MVVKAAVKDELTEVVGVASSAVVVMASADVEGGAAVVGAAVGMLVVVVGDGADVNGGVDVVLAGESVVEVALAAVVVVEGVGAELTEAAVVGGEVVAPATSIAYIGA